MNSLKLGRMYQIVYCYVNGPLLGTLKEQRKDAVFPCKEPSNMHLHKKQFALRLSAWIEADGVPALSILTANSTAGSLTFPNISPPPLTGIQTARKALRNLDRNLLPHPRPTQFLVKLGCVLHMCKVQATKLVSISCELSI